MNNNNDKNNYGIDDLDIPDHMILWEQLQTRCTSYEDDQDILFCVDPKDSHARIFISKCPHCNRANNTDIGTHAQFGTVKPTQAIGIDCIYCKKKYKITYEILAMPYHTVKI